MFKKVDSKFRKLFQSESSVNMNSVILNQKIQMILRNFPLIDMNPKHKQLF